MKLRPPEANNDPTRQVMDKNPDLNISLLKYPKWGDWPYESTSMSVIERDLPKGSVLLALRRFTHFFIHMVWDVYESERITEEKNKGWPRERWIYHQVLIDNFKDLGIPKNASQEEIEKLMREFVTTHHPDKIKEPDADKVQKFSKDLERWRLMCDPLLRERYVWSNKRQLQYHHVYEDSIASIERRKKKEEEPLLQMVDRTRKEVFPLVLYSQGPKPFRLREGLINTPQVVTQEPSKSGEGVLTEAPLNQIPSSHKINNPVPDAPKVLSPDVDFRPVKIINPVPDAPKLRKPVPTAVNIPPAPKIIKREKVERGSNTEAGAFGNDNSAKMAFEKSESVEKKYGEKIISIIKDTRFALLVGAGLISIAIINSDKIHPIDGILEIVDSLKSDTNPEDVGNQPVAGLQDPDDITKSQEEREIEQMKVQIEEDLKIMTENDYPTMAKKLREEWGKIPADSNLQTVKDFYEKVDKASIEAKKNFEEKQPSAATQEVSDVQSAHTGWDMNEASKIEQTIPKQAAEEKNSKEIEPAKLQDVKEEVKKVKTEDESIINKEEVVLIAEMKAEPKNQKEEKTDVQAIVTEKNDAKSSGSANTVTNENIPKDVRYKSTGWKMYSSDVSKASALLWQDTWTKDGAVAALILVCDDIKTSSHAELSKPGYEKPKTVKTGVGKNLRKIEAPYGIIIDDYEVICKDNKGKHTYTLEIIGE